MPLFKDVANMEVLYEYAFKKLLQTPEMGSLVERLFTEGRIWLKSLNNIYMKLLNEQTISKDTYANTLKQAEDWINVNLEKTNDSKIIKIINEMKSFLSKIRSVRKTNRDDDIKKAGVKGRSGRQAGYMFEPYKHPRGAGGKFASKGKVEVKEKQRFTPPQYITTEAGRKIPSYTVVGGKRVGRGIQQVSAVPSYAAARMAGHLIHGAVESASSEAARAFHVGAERVSQKHLRERSIIEALQRRLLDPKVPVSEKAKIKDTLRRMSVKRFKETGKTEVSTAGQEFKEEMSTGFKTAAKTIPWRLMVGAVSGSLRGLMERWRTNPILAPLDIRVRPDILESGLRTAASTLGNKNVSRATEILRSAREERRPLTVNEYGQLSSVVGFDKNERKVFRDMLDGLDIVRSKVDIKLEDLQEAATIENSLDRMVGSKLASLIESGTKEAYETSHARAAVRRIVARPTLPKFKLGRAERMNIERLIEGVKAGTIKA